MHAKRHIKHWAYIIAATLLILWVLPLASIWPWQLWHGWCSVSATSSFRELDPATLAPELRNSLQSHHQELGLQLEAVGLLTHETERRYTFTGRIEKSSLTSVLCCYSIASQGTLADVVRWQKRSYAQNEMRSGGQGGHPGWWPERGMMIPLRRHTLNHLYWCEPGKPNRLYEEVHLANVTHPTNASTGTSMSSEYPNK